MKRGNGKSERVPVSENTLEGWASIIEQSAAQFTEPTKVRVHWPLDQGGCAEDRVNHRKWLNEWTTTLEEAADVDCPACLDRAPRDPGNGLPHLCFRVLHPDDLAPCPGCGGLLNLRRK